MGVAGVSEFFYYGSKFKIKKIFFGCWKGGEGGGGGARVSDFFLKKIKI